MWKMTEGKDLDWKDIVVMKATNNEAGICIEERKTLRYT